MTGACVVCGDEAAPGQFGTRCVECVTDDTTEVETNTIVLETHYEYGGGLRLVAEKTDSSWTLTEQRLMMGGEWRTVGSEPAMDIRLRTQE